MQEPTPLSGFMTKAVKILWGVEVRASGLGFRV